MLVASPTCLQLGIEHVNINGRQQQQQQDATTTKRSSPRSATDSNVNCQLASVASARAVPANSRAIPASSTRTLLSAAVRNCVTEDYRLVILSTLIIPQNWQRCAQISRLK